MSVSRQRICRLAEQASATGAPAEALLLVQQLRQEIDDFERQQVARALTAGEPVSAVARALGVSRQSAHRRFRELVPPRVRSRRSHPTPEARLAVEYARREAGEQGAPDLGGEHLLLGVLRSGDHPIVAELEELGVTFDAVRAVVPLHLGEIQRTGEIRMALNNAALAARREGTDQVGLEHMLTGALGDPAGGATAVLRALGVRPNAVAALVAKRS